MSLAPFYHPLRLAEEVALLDMLSGGRVNWGAGRGFARVEFTAFGVPPEESTSRFRETVEIVLRAWTDERLTFPASILSSTRSRCCPSRAAAASAGMDGRDLGRRARMGRGARFLDPDGPACLSRRDRPKYDACSAAREVAGFPPPGDTPMARLVAVAETDAEAEEIARAGAQWTVASYIGGGTEEYVRDKIIWGSPARCATSWIVSAR